MPWSRIPQRPTARRPVLVATILDPVLLPIGFAPGQVGELQGGRAQVIFCRGLADTPDGGCLDLVVEVDASPKWRVSDVRYWGFPSDRWHLDFDRDASLADQLAGLAETLPATLGRRNSTPPDGVS